MEPRTDWQETVPEGEHERFERYAEQLRELQRERAKRRLVTRGLHAKANAGVEAELRVLGDLPVAARAGVFAKPQTYRA